MSQHTTRKMHLSTIRCLLFDLGQTLWARDPLNLLQLIAITDQHVLEILHQTFPSRHFSADVAAVLRDTLIKCFRTEIDEHPYLEPEGSAMMRHALLTLGLDNIEDVVCQAIFDVMQTSIAQTRTLFPDAITTLQAIHQRSYRLGVVTNRFWGGQSFQEDLQTMGLLTYFDLAKVIVSADTHLRKPNPAIFQLALDACYVRATETAMIGDSLIADIAGSQQLGIFAIWKPYNYTEIEAYLQENENISIALYNQQRLTSYAEWGVKLSSMIYQREDEVSDLVYFASGKIRPQLIIKDLGELLTWFL